VQEREACELEVPPQQGTHRRTDRAGRQTPASAKSGEIGEQPIKIWSPAGRPSRNSASGVRLSLSAPCRARIHVAITLLDLMQGIEKRGPGYTRRHLVRSRFLLRQGVRLSDRKVTSFLVGLSAGGSVAAFLAAAVKERTLRESELLIEIDRLTRKTDDLAVQAEKERKANQRLTAQLSAERSRIADFAGLEAELRQRLGRSRALRPEQF
jgi:hypothetical protein